MLTGCVSSIIKVLDFYGKSSVCIKIQRGGVNLRFFKKQQFKISLLVVIILTFIIPDINPSNQIEDTYRFSYGLPFNYFSIYADTYTNWLFPKLFTGNEGVRIDLFNAFLNVLVLYFPIAFVMKRINK